MDSGQDSADGVVQDLSTEELRELYRSAPDGIVIVSEQGLIRHANPQAETMFGYGAGELLGHPIELLVPKESHSTHVRSRQAYAKDPHSRPMGIELELEGRRKDGSKFPVEISLSGVKVKGSVSVVGIVRDMTERRRLRAYGNREIQAAEEERRRIARDLHDETAQDLAALIIQLRTITLEQDPERKRQLSEQLRDGLVEAVEGLRRIARGLRPPALDELGVAGAIEAYARDLGTGAGIPIDVDVARGDLPLTPAAQLELYRVIQEALTNAVRHGGGGRISVRLTLLNGYVNAVVEDEGIGFSPELELRRADGGLGIVGMKERARHAGGRVEISSKPGQGTQVRISLPVDRETING